jgi:hypothetical protein
MLYVKHSQKTFNLFILYLLSSFQYLLCSSSFFYLHFFYTINSAYFSNWNNSITFVPSFQYLHFKSKKYQRKCTFQQTKYSSVQQLFKHFTSLEIMLSSCKQSSNYIHIHDKSEHSNIFIYSLKQKRKNS